MTLALAPGWDDDEDDEARQLLLAYARNRQMKGQLLFTRSGGVPRESRFETPGQLAKALDPTTVQTPALDLIDEVLCRVDAYIAGDDENGLNRVVFSMPPQEGKSERISHYFPEWLLQRHPDLRIVLTSYGDDIVRRHSTAIRNDILMHSGQEQTLDLGLRLAQGSKASNRWSLEYPYKGSVIAVTIKGGLSGRPADVLVIDDPVKDWAEAESPVISEAVWNWWTSVARARLGPRAVVVVIQTRWHEKDLTGRLLTLQAEQEALGKVNIDKWHVVNIPAQADHDPEKGQVDILGREPGEFMVSARGRTQAEWEATMNATPPQQWNALFQGRPSAKTGSIFFREWWRRYDEPLWTLRPDGTFRLPAEFDVYQSWDFAFRGNDTSDFVVGQVWARKGAESFLVYQDRHRRTFTETLDAIRRMTRLFPQARKKIMEAKANGDAIIDSLRKEVPGIVEANPTQSKPARASAVSVFVRAGNVKVPTVALATMEPEIAWDVTAFLDECTTFDNGTNDDQVDALTQYLAEVYLVGGDATAESPKGVIPRTATKVQAPRSGMPTTGSVQDMLTRRAQGR